MPRPAPFRFPLHPILLLPAVAAVRLNGSLAMIRQRRLRKAWSLLTCVHVIHSYVRRPNVLWNLERRRVMLVDFGRAEVLDDRKRQILSHISVNLGGSKRGRHLTPM